MPLTNTANLTTLYTQVRSFIRTRFQNRGINDGQFLGKLTRTLSMALLGVQQTLEAIDRDSPPSSKSSSNGISSWAFTYGVPSNAGGFGANTATAAGGGQALVTGTGGTHVLAGTQATAPDGTTTLQLLDPGPGYGVIPFTGSFVAVTKGTVGNLPIGTTLNWVSPPAGCDATIFLTNATTGGTDAESPADLLVRLLERLQVPPKGGANIDWITWALAVAGIFGVYVYPRRHGTGTVDVVLTQNGTGTQRQATDPEILAVENAFAAVAPTDIENINVYAPYMPASQALSVVVQAVPASPKYAWDWNDTGTSYTVAGYNAGAKTLTLNTTAPADLQAAITAGLQPRVQVVISTTNHAVVTEQRRVVSIDVTHLILTLDSAFSVAPTTGDRVYAGSYFAPIVATNLNAYIDAQGPSRASGFADTVTTWNDYISTMSLAGVAEDSVDTNGARLLTRVPINGVTIAIGSGSASVQDYVPPDDYSNAPQLAYAAHVTVIQPQ